MPAQVPDGSRGAAKDLKAEERDLSGSVLAVRPQTDQHANDDRTVGQEKRTQLIVFADDEVAMRWRRL